MPFPSPPWTLRADACASVFVLPSGSWPDRPAGAYGAAFVDYREGGVLRYHELLVARLVLDGHMPRVRVTDIWVDSPESMSGGRALWGIPKELADLPLNERHAGPVSRSSFRVVTGDREPVRGTFTSVPGAALVRAPFLASTSQVRDDGSTVVAPLSGSARAVPCYATWAFSADGPLAFLADRWPVVSLHLRDVRLRFG